MKRGQITIFVILGIVLLAIIILGITFRSEISRIVSDFELAKSEEVVRLETDLTIYSESCLEKTALEGIQLIILNGGYYPVSPEHLEYGIYRVPLYLNQDKENVPSIEDIGVSLARYVEDNLDNCLRAYPENLEFGQPKVEVIFSNEILIDVQHSLSYEYENFRVRVRRFNTLIDFDLNYVYNSAIDFFDELKNISNTGLMSQIDMALSSDFQFYNHVLDNHNVIYGLIFENVLEDKNIYYQFALRYPVEEITEDVDFFDLSGIFGDFEIGEIGSIDEYYVFLDPPFEEEDTDEF